MLLNFAQKWDTTGGLDRNPEKAECLKCLVITLRLLLCAANEQLVNSHTTYSKVTAQHVVACRQAVLDLLKLKTDIS